MVGEGLSVQKIIAAIEKDGDTSAMVTHFKEILVRKQGFRDVIDRLTKIKNSLGSFLHLSTIPFSKILHL